MEHLRQTGAKCRAISYWENPPKAVSHLLAIDYRQGIAMATHLKVNKGVKLLLAKQFSDYKREKSNENHYAIRRACIKWQDYDENKDKDHTDPYNKYGSRLTSSFRIEKAKTLRFKVHIKSKYGLDFSHKLHETLLWLPMKVNKHYENISRIK